MEDWYKQGTSLIASGVEVAAAIIIALGAIEALISVLIIFFFRRDAPEESKDAIRLRLGRWLVMALEFELAADILRTAIAPTWDEIGQLAAIVVLRTVLNYFLQREINKPEFGNNNTDHTGNNSGGNSYFAWWPRKNQKTPDPTGPQSAETTPDR